MIEKEQLRPNNIIILTIPVKDMGAPLLFNALNKRISIIKDNSYTKKLFTEFYNS
jgi:hypothetical protein